MECTAVWYEGCTVLLACKKKVWKALSWQLHGQTQRKAKKRRPTETGCGGDVAADAMDDGQGREVGAGRGVPGDDGGHGAPGPGRPVAPRPLAGPPRHPHQAARLLPPLHGIPARPRLQPLPQRPLPRPRSPLPPRRELVFYYPGAASCKEACGSREREVVKSARRSPLDQ